MFAVISFDNVAHRDNERTSVYGPFITSDFALRYAEHCVKFYHVVRIEGVSGSGVKTSKTEDK
jgi:hypothetical protein